MGNALLKLIDEEITHAPTSDDRAIAISIWRNAVYTTLIERGLSKAEPKVVHLFPGSVTTLRYEPMWRMVSDDDLREVREFLSGVRAKRTMNASERGLSESEMNRIIVLAKRGMPMSQISRELDIPVAYVQSVFREHGIVPRRGRPPKDPSRRMEPQQPIPVNRRPRLKEHEYPIAEMIYQYQQGLTVRQVADKLDFAESTVFRLLTKHGVTRSRTEARALLRR